jgi:hypothetical protein
VGIDRRTALIGAATLATLGTVETTAAQSPTEKSSSAKEKVTGIGGFFFKSRSPKALAQWYQLHLGVDPVPSSYNESPWQQAAGPTAFAPFPTNTDYFGAPEQAFMVNFRVKNLDAMVAQLKEAGIAVKVDAETYPNGRFARLHDPDGNPIELWEPAISS